MIKILDLFAGIGGTARGIQKYLIENGIDFEYVAVDNDQEVLAAHKKLCPESTVVRADAYSYDVTGFNFIWASPPCQTHSMCNMYYNRKNPDMRLWDLIRKLQQQKISFIVENVKPYYSPPIKPVIKIDRHLFWSNLALVPFSVSTRFKAFNKMSIRDWEEYHNIPSKVTEHILDRMKRRQVLRNVCHSSISYNILKQFFHPKQKILEVQN
ncbi:MAG: DNA cytosine methyltransferase [Candidatus Heimdallarchaeaceae archaeon]